MTYTPYSSKNAAFSNSVHEFAQRELYPKIFHVPFERLLFESTLLEYGRRGEVLDGQMAIDRIVKIASEDEKFHLPLQITIQERFRREDAATWQDLTITEWNPKSDLPSELYKIIAGMFVYGYCEAKEYKAGDKWVCEPRRFVDAIAVDTAKMLVGIGNGELSYSWGFNPRTEQPFLTIKFQKLYEYGAVLYWQTLAERGNSSDTLVVTQQDIQQRKLDF